MSGYGDLIFISCCFWVPYAIYFVSMLTRNVRMPAQEPVPDMA